jgi:hypothetical protein
MSRCYLLLLSASSISAPPKTPEDSPRYLKALLDSMNDRRAWRGLSPSASSS